MAGKILFIGRLAQHGGTIPKTIRYYEAIGLLPEPARGPNRYRLYPKESVALLQFIKKAQALGFTLSEVREIVQLHRKGEAPCGHVRMLLERKVADLDQCLEDLVALRRKLEILLARTKDGTARGKTPAGVCPHIEGVSADPRPRA